MRCESLPPIDFAFVIEGNSPAKGDFHTCKGALDPNHNPPAFDGFPRFP
jgi:hypothetical protein